MRLIIPTILSVVIMMGLFFGYVMWLNQDEEYEVVGISAPGDENATLPVYAQFIVAQRLVIDEAAEVTKIVLPMYLDHEGPSFSVSLRQGDKEIKKWQLPSVNDEVVEGNNQLSLLLDGPRLLEGQMEVVVDASKVGHEDQETAPRVFIQKEDDYYPDGNYRIADNEKAGDMGVYIMARQSRWQSVLKRFEQSRLSLIAWVAARVVLVLVVSSLPVVILGGRFRLG